MKRLTIAVTACMLALAIVAADAPKAHAGLEPYAQYWNSDGLGSGWGVGLRAYRAIIPMVGIDARVAWINFDRARIYPLEVAGVAQLGLLYGGLGVGYYIFDHKDFDSDNSTGWFLLAGARFSPFNLIGVYGELRWTFVDTKINGLDVDADGFGATAGVIINLF